MGDTISYSGFYCTRQIAFKESIMQTNHNQLRLITFLISILIATFGLGPKWVKADSGMIVGGPLNGSILPGSEGGMVIGGPLNGSILPGSDGGMVIGGPLNGSIMPDGNGGMVIGGPLNGSILPGREGGMVIGGPLNGSILPGRQGGMVILRSQIKILGKGLLLVHQPRNIVSTTIHNFRYGGRRSIVLDHWQAIDEISIYDSYDSPVGE